jgi:hypothetical protein
LFKWQSNSHKNNQRERPVYQVDGSTRAWGLAEKLKEVLFSWKGRDGFGGETKPLVQMKVVLKKLTLRLMLAVLVFGLATVISLHVRSDDVFTPDTPDGMDRAGFPFLIYQSGGPVSLEFQGRGSPRGSAWSVGRTSAPSCIAGGKRARF